MACLHLCISRRSRARVDKDNHQKPVRDMQISAPFGFKKEATVIPGLSDDMLTMLREKALATRLGVADDHGSIRPSPSIPVRPSGGPISSNPVLSGDDPEKDLDEQHHGPETTAASLI